MKTADSSTYSDQLCAIRERYSTAFNRDVYIKNKALQEQQEKQQRLEYVKGQINGYLSGPYEVSTSQIIIVIRALTDLLTPLDHTDRQSLIANISDFTLRFNKSIPFIDFRKKKTQHLITEIDLANALFLSMDIPIQLAIDMNTDNDQSIACSLMHA